MKLVFLIGDAAVGKRDTAASDRRLINDDARYRLESYAGEIPFETISRSTIPIFPRKKRQSESKHIFICKEPVL